MHPYFETQEGTIRIFVSENLIFPEHMHSHVEFLYVLEGETHVSLSDSMYHLKKGDSFIIFPGQTHGYHSESPCKIRLILADPSLLGSMQYSLQNRIPVNPLLIAEDAPEDLLLAIEKLSVPSSVIHVWILLLFSLVFEKLELVKRDSSTVSLTCQLVQYMADHFQETLSLDSIAKALHVNKYYLSHIFSDKIHVSFPKYLNHLRVDYACKLMLQSSKPLSHIWEEAGFSSQRSFNRAFQELRGVSPLQYRKTQVSAKPSDSTEKTEPF